MYVFVCACVCACVCVCLFRAAPIDALRERAQVCRTCVFMCVCVYVYLCVRVWETQSVCQIYKSMYLHKCIRPDESCRAYKLVACGWVMSHMWKSHVTQMRAERPLHIHIYTYIYTYVCMYIYTYIYIHTYVCIFLYISHSRAERLGGGATRRLICIYIHKYFYIYIYMNMYICTCMCIYIQKYI